MKNTRGCPICQQSMMTRMSHGVEIDLCGVCGGLWLDSGELDLLLTSRFNVGGVESALDASAKLPTLCRYCNVEQTDGRVSCRSCSRSLGIRCPVDGRGMHIVRFGALEFDRCSACRGIWVDGFEREGLGEQAKNIQRERATVFVVPTAGLGGLGAGSSAGDWSSESDWGGGASSGSRGGEKSSQTRSEPARLDVECNGCKRAVNRYSAWAYGEEFWCLQCAERSDVKVKLQASAELQRTMHESVQKRGLPLDGGTWDSPHGYNRRYDLDVIDIGYELLAGVLRSLFRIF